MERPARDGDSPVIGIAADSSRYAIVYFPSTTEHVKFCGNLPRPLGKAKYSLMTDSGQVPRGKGEKNPGRGVK